MVDDVHRGESPLVLNLQGVLNGKKVTERTGFSADHRNGSLHVARLNLSYFTDHRALAQSLILGCPVPVSPEEPLSASFVWLFCCRGKIARENDLSA